MGWQLRWCHSYGGSHGEGSTATSVLAKYGLQISWEAVKDFNSKALGDCYDIGHGILSMRGDFNLNLEHWKIESEQGI